jgi:hypothetical protein
LKQFVVPTIGQIQFANKYIIGVVNFDSTDSGFYAPEDNYVWQPRKDYENIGQSSGLVNLTEPRNSDFRVVSFMRTFKSKMASNTFQAFADSLKIFPFRTQFTSALTGFS